MARVLVRSQRAQACRPPILPQGLAVALAWGDAHCRNPGQGASRVTSFFIAGVGSKGAAVEEAYSELRERSMLAAGCPARSRRIFKLSCRFDGQDREIEVGRPLCKGGDVVVAILDHGRSEAFCVHTDRSGQSAPARVSHPVYSVTEFS
jgi:hypothetical protein